MNRLFSFIILSLTTLSGFAQPTIDYLNWGFENTSQRYYVSYQKLSPNPVPPGNGVTWDFTALAGDPHDSIIFTANGGNTPFTFDFPKANVTFYKYFAPNKETWMTHFYKDQWEFSFLGDGQVGGSTYPFSTSQKMLKFPMTFNKQFKESYKISGGSSGNVIVKYDGYGTLKLPGGTYNNVYRTTCKDSISATKITYRYEWFDLDKRIMYMSVNTETIITYLNNRPKASGGIQSNSKPLEINVYPNPNSGNFNISLPTAISRGVIEITNIYGQVVIRKDIVNPTAGFELKDKGVYLVSVYSDGQKFFKKLLVD